MNRTYVDDEVADLVGVGRAGSVHRSGHEVRSHVVPVNPRSVVQASMEHAQIVVLFETESHTSPLETFRKTHSFSAAVLSHNGGTAEGIYTKSTILLGMTTHLNFSGVCMISNTTHFSQKN